MIRHIVLVQFRKEVDEHQIAALFGEIEALQPRVPGMLRVVFGQSLELEKLEKGFRHGFIVEFDGRPPWRPTRTTRTIAGRAPGSWERPRVVLRASLFSTSQPENLRYVAAVQFCPITSSPRRSA